MPPQALDFTEADFDTAPAGDKAPLDFTEEDFAPARPKIEISPYETQRQAQPMGPMGPLNPQEVLNLPKALLAPAAAIEATGIPDALSDIAADFRRRTGIDPSAQPGVPAVNVTSLPIAHIPGTGIAPLDLISPELTKGIEEGAGKIVSGLTAPGLAETIPAGILAPKLVGGGFAAQMLAGVPQDVAEVAQAKNLREAGSAGLQAVANLGLGASLASHLLPRASRLAAETLTEKGVTDATKEGIQQENIPVQRPGDGEGGPPAEPGVSGGVPPEAGLGQETQIPLRPGVQKTRTGQVSFEFKLSPEEQDYLEAERASLDVPIEVERKPLEGNEPFAGQIATVNRQRGSIVINPQEFSEWLNTVPETNRSEAVKALVGEERIHLAVDDGSATAYWQDLTSLEKAIERRRYTGHWRGVGLDDTLMGHEAVRFRLQQLARATPREIAEAVGRERWTVQAITTLEDVVRKLRETFGTKASLEQLGILDRMQENLKAAAGAVKGTNPSAYRKGRSKDEPELYLPPVKTTIGAGETEAKPEGVQQVPGAAPEGGGGVLPGVPRAQGPGVARESYLRQTRLPLSEVPAGESAERSGFGLPKAIAIESAAREHFDNAFRAGKSPSFDEFLGELQSQYGSGITRESIWHQWQDTMVSRLMSATGKELETALKSEDVTFPRGTIPDAIDIPKAHQAQFEEMAKLFPHKKVITPRAVRQWFGPGLRRRYEAVGTLIDRYSREAGPKPQKPWERAEVGPEEVTSIAGDRQYRALTPAEASDPVKLGDIATRNAAVEATGKGAPPRTVSKNLVSLRDKSGRVVLVSAFRDPRAGPKVSNPAAAGQPALKIDAKLLQDWTPLSVMTLRDPVKDFRQVFPSQDAFAKWFGDIGIEGTPGIETSSFTGPERGLVEAQAGLRPGGPRPAETGIPLEFTEKDFESPTATELTAPQRGAIRTGTALYRSPRAEAPPAEKLPLNEKLEAQRKAGEAFPYEPTSYTPSSALEARGIQIMPGARGERPGPRAINKQAIKDQFELVEKGIAASILRRATREEIPRMLDAADSNTAMAAANARSSIERASRQDFTKPKGFFAGREAVAEEAREAKTTREAAIAYISSGFTDQKGNWRPSLSRLTKGIPAGGSMPATPSFEEYLRRGEARAQSWLHDPNPLKRSEGRRDLAYIEKLRGLLDYASKHWKDPEFVRAAQQFRNEMKDALDFEALNGFPTIAHDSYIPGRYEGSFWNDNLIRFAGRKLLGASYRLPKAFANPFEAIAAGPYRMVELDLASLAEHRIAQGRKQVEQNMAISALKSMNDPVSNKPVAMNPAQYKITDPVTGEEITRYKSPDPNYVLIYNRRGQPPIAVRDAYARIVRVTTAPSRIEEIPGGKTAIVLNQMLKHGAILLWDTFHPGRIGQYVMALNGFKGAGWRGGITALEIRPHEMADAVRKGMITKEAADWATEKIDIGRGNQITRQQLLTHLIQSGLNAQKLTDAIYRSAIQHVPFIGERYHRLIDPYNQALFGRFIPGVIAESAVNNFERLRRENPSVKFSDLTRDIVRDTNVFFGNMGRQGILKSKTAQQLAQIALLAPAWQEGLFQKEIRFASRLGLAGARGVGFDPAYRQGLPALGMLGEGMARGIVSYIVGTQLINLATRQKFTWQNPESDHKLDAWVQLPWMKSGVWLSPLSVLAEVTHDLIRLLGTKERAWDVVRQMGENRLSPVGKMAMILTTGMSPQEQYYSTTPGLLRGAASQVVPLAGASPISLSVPARAIGHALAPSLVSPNQPGALLRQTLAAASGTKTELQKTAIQQMMQKTQDFIRREGLQKDTGWKQIQTDDPSYSKLRTALRLDDTKQAKKMLDSLRKNRTDAQIEQAMKIWAKRPWTGSHQNDTLLRFSMSDEDADLMSKADGERMEMLQKFYDALLVD